MKKGFTLIELLAVVTIMAIILVAAIPIFQSMGKRDLGVTAAQLRTTLRLARQYAVTQRQDVFVVFPDNRADCSTNDVDKLLRSYAVIMTNALSGGYEYITDWKFFPQGVYFDDTDSPGVNTGSVFKAGVVTPFPLPFPVSSGQVRSMPHICFRPNGRAYAYTGSSFANNNFTLYFTTARFYTKDNDGNRLDAGTHIAGVTNTVRVRRYTGQVDIRDGVSY